MNTHCDRCHAEISDDKAYAVDIPRNHIVWAVDRYGNKLVRLYVAKPTKATLCKKCFDYLLWFTDCVDEDEHEDIFSNTN